ncbi:MAG: hypothetical protein UU09_C0046G0009 [Microgenomates group bacterium GW2011_GWA2_40_6]|nr:MAG: hypothetical protein UU09_C0046G0009 [Microgenomates group bacterium GW2011_GWA2_40_6]
MGQRGITTVLMDLDDTSVDTSGVFGLAFYEASENLLKSHTLPMVKRALSAAEVKAKYMDVVIGAIRREFGVRPTISVITTMLTAKWLGLAENNEAVVAAIDRIKRMYTDDVPEMLEGASEAIEALNFTNRKILLVSHAEREWTMHKLRGCGLESKFAEVHCFSVERSKRIQWDEWFKKTDIDPERCLVIGDNRDGDILEPVLLGSSGVWVNRQGNRFSVEGESDGDWSRAVKTGRVSIIGSIGQFPEVMINGGGLYLNLSLRMGDFLEQAPKNCPVRENRNQFLSKKSRQERGIVGVVGHGEIRINERTGQVNCPGYLKNEWEMNLGGCATCPIRRL